MHARRIASYQRWAAPLRDCLPTPYLSSSRRRP